MPTYARAILERFAPVPERERRLTWPEAAAVELRS